MKVKTVSQTGREVSRVLQYNGFLSGGCRSELSGALNTPCWNEPPSKSNTSVLADLWVFKEKRVTALPPCWMIVCGCPLTVLGISPSPGGGGGQSSRKKDYTVWQIPGEKTQETKPAALLFRLTTWVTEKQNKKKTEQRTLMFVIWKPCLI